MCNDGATQTIGFDRNATLDDWPKVYNTHLSLQRARALIEWEGSGRSPFRQHKQNERKNAIPFSWLCAITHADTRTQNQSIIFYFRGWIFTHVNTLPAKPFHRIYFDAITHRHRTTHTHTHQRLLAWPSSSSLSSSSVGAVQCFDVYQRNGISFNH